MSQQADTAPFLQEAYRLSELERMAEQDIRQMLWKIFRMMNYTDEEIHAEFRKQIDKRASQVLN